MPIITTTEVLLSFTNCGFLVFTADIVELDSILEQHALIQPLIIIIQNSPVQVDQNVCLCIIMFVVTSDLMTSYIEFSPIIVMATLTVQTVRTLPAFVS